MPCKRRPSQSSAAIASIVGWASRLVTDHPGFVWIVPGDARDALNRAVSKVTQASHGGDCRWARTCGVGLDCWRQTGMADERGCAGGSSVSVAGAGQACLVLARALRVSRAVLAEHLAVRHNPTMSLPSVCVQRSASRNGPGVYILRHGSKWQATDEPLDRLPVFVALPLATYWHGRAYSS